MQVFATIDSVVQAFKRHELKLAGLDTILINEEKYTPGPLTVSDAGQPSIKLVSETGDTTLNFVWGSMGASFLPESVSVSHDNVVVEEPEVECGEACQILEHRASVAGTVIQALIEDNVERPTLYLNEKQFKSVPRDKESLLPTMGRLTLDDQTVFVYEDIATGELIIPTIHLDTLDGVVLHNVRVKLEHSQCTHLALPKSMFGPPSS